MKVAVWIREDLKVENPVNVDFYDGDIRLYVTDTQLTVMMDMNSVQYPLKDVSMIDFNYKEYKDHEKS